MVLIADAAPRPDGVGRRRRGVPARSASRRETRGEAAAERVEAVRQRPARLHRPALRDAGGAARAGDDAAALRPDRGRSRATSSRIKETLTLKPDGFRIRARGAARAPFRRGARCRRAAAQAARAAGGRRRAADGRRPRCSCCTARTPARPRRSPQRIASDAPAQGYARRRRADGRVRRRACRTDGAVDRRDRVVRRPAARQRAPVRRLARGRSRAGELAGVRYAVFGCGNRQWARTYQAIPKRIDAALDGGRRDARRARGEADAAATSSARFDDWYAGAVGRPRPRRSARERARRRPQARAASRSRSSRPAATRALRLERPASTASVVENRELVDMSVAARRSKRHIEIALPEGMSYRAGDYLAVLPRNPPERRGAGDAALRLRAGHAGRHPQGDGDAATSLPIDYPVAVAELLGQLRRARPAGHAEPGRAARRGHALPAREGRRSTRWRERERLRGARCSTSA